MIFYLLLKKQLTGLKFQMTASLRAAAARTPTPMTVERLPGATEWRMPFIS